MKDEKIHRFNGNGQQYTTDLPKLVILTYINPTALDHIAQNTRLFFKEGSFGNLTAQPTNSNQVVTLLLTYNFKTKYYNNATHKNTLFLKGDHHQGFDVDSICYDCAQHNHMTLPVGLETSDRLAT